MAELEIKVPIVTSRYSNNEIIRQGIIMIPKIATILSNLVTNTKDVSTPRRYAQTRANSRIADPNGKAQAHHTILLEAIKTPTKANSTIRSLIESKSLLFKVSVLLRYRSIEHISKDADTNEYQTPIRLIY
jgi:hypothetical protein